MDSSEIEHIYSEVENEIENILEEITNIDSNNEEVKEIRNRLEEFANNSRNKVFEEVNILRASLKTRGTNLQKLGNRLNY